MVVMIMGQKNRRGSRNERSPETRDGRFGQPWKQPGIKQKEVLTLAVHEGGMPQVRHILILGRSQPMRSHRRAW